ncbi:MAG: hypothetical protein KF721_07630, partial [Ignavibacteriaceae bacterium]|nr:hypothetical protein [Ignavibacteriaceae bacterium]
LETRLPMLDHRLVNFSLNLQTNLLIKNGWTKYILRKTINELPSEIKWRSDKRGFVIPEERWLKCEYKSRVYEIFNKSILDSLGLINEKKFITFYEDFLSNKKNIHYSDISRVIIAEMWAREFIGSVKL